MFSFQQTNVFNTENHVGRKVCLDWHTQSAAV